MRIPTSQLSGFQKGSKKKQQLILAFLRLHFQYEIIVEIIRTGNCQTMDGKVLKGTNQLT